MEESLAKYRTDLIDTQNKNKDLRQKIVEVEEAKESLEKAQEKTLHEIDDLRAALNDSQLTAEQAEIARQEAIEARAQMDQALHEMDQRLASVNKEAELAEGTSYVNTAVTDAANHVEPVFSDDEPIAEPLDSEDSHHPEEEPKPHHFW